MTSEEMGARSIPMLLEREQAWQEFNRFRLSQTLRERFDAAMDFVQFGKVQCPRS